MIQAVTTGAAPGLPGLLARWRLSPPSAAQQPVVERLGDWLAWTDAVTLAQALSLAPDTGTEPLAAVADWAHAALERLRTELATSFADTVLVGDNASPPALSFADAFAPYRLHHAQQQRTLTARVGSLRERLRVKLAGSRSQRLARLAQLDAVFERALSERTRQASGALPGLLAQRATALHVADPATWCARLWAELQALLAAELDLHLQPVLGLHEALCSEPR